MNIVVDVLPHVNAVLNGLSTVLLCAGLAFIRQGRRTEHRRAMTAAIIVSGFFLASYLVYHFSAPVFAFPGTGWSRPVYFTLLASHVVLATAVTPLAAMTAIRAFKGYRRDPALVDASHFAAHKSVARWALPVWLYVTVTGVLVYGILYHYYDVTPVAEASDTDRAPTAGDRHDG